jgi:2-dehydro-3-deoxy-D-gluconate 5-dehydrogenase
MKTPTLFDLTGRVVVVTGGNGGIGRGIALGLAQAGAAVAVFGRNDEKNQRVFSELKVTGVPSIAVRVDVTNGAGLQPALNTVESEFGVIGILVNNARQRFIERRRVATKSMAIELAPHDIQVKCDRAGVD